MFEERSRSSLQNMCKNQSCQKKSLISLRIDVILKIFIWHRIVLEISTSNTRAQLCTTQTDLNVSFSAVKLCPFGSKTYKYTPRILAKFNEPTFCSWYYVHHTQKVWKTLTFTPHIVTRWECRHFVCWQHVECGPTQNNEYSRYLALSMWGWIQASNDTLTSNPVILSMHLNVLYSPPKNGQNKSKVYFLKLAKKVKSFRVLFTNFTHSFDIAGSRGNWQKMSLWIINTISSASTNNAWSRHYITVTQQRRKKVS